MKFTSAAWVLALLAFTSQIDNFAMAQDNVEEPAADTEADAPAAEGDVDVGAEGDAPADGELVADSEVVDEDVEEDIELANTEPEGPALTSEFYILEQAAFNWLGFPIRKPFTSKQVEKAFKNFDNLKAADAEFVKANEDEELKTITELQISAMVGVQTDEINPVVGVINGQTGWTSINQAGDKTMSYQVSIVIKAEEDLRDILFANSETGTMFGWWIPQRAQLEPAEEWQMNLCQVTALSNDSMKFNMRQTKWTGNLSGLVPGFDVKETLKVFFNDDDEAAQDKQSPTVNEWVFSGGALISTDVTKNDPNYEEFLAVESKYWVPVPKYSSLSQDKLVITLEGIEYKEWLPALRNGSKVPFTFQFIDDVNGSKVLRNQEKVELNFGLDYNRCTLPRVCPIIEEADEDSATALTTLFASAFALATALSF